MTSMRKGYGAEYHVKLKLEKKYGRSNVRKMPFWSFLGDFIVIEPRGSRILKLVEVKSSMGRWYPDMKDVEQFKKISSFSRRHGIPAEYWIREGRRWSVATIEQVKVRLKLNAGRER